MAADLLREGLSGFLQDLPPGRRAAAGRGALTDQELAEAQSAARHPAEEVALGPQVAPPLRIVCFFAMADVSDALLRLHAVSFGPRDVAPEAA
ncbi:MAG: hypothetical protein LC624_09095 [Halobacteriales archaeon]|nr:hypothetical protein [Halobacteriales archaeon]